MANQDAILPLRQAYADFVNLIGSLSEGTFLSSMNGWAPRDVAAHLVGWNLHMIEASSSILAGRKPDYYEDTPNDYSNMNARFTKEYSSRSKEELLQQLKSTMEKFEAFVLTLPPAELAADHGVRHYTGSPATVNRIIASLAGDYLYHTLQIREWLDGK